MTEPDLLWTTDDSGSVDVLHSLDEAMEYHLAGLTIAEWPSEVTLYGYEPIIFPTASPTTNRSA